MLFKSPSYLLYGFLLFSIPSAFADGTQPLPSLADEGLPDAQYDYGMRLINGHDYKQDPVAGRQWIEKAAKQGKTEAETQLGKMCLNGEGVPANVAPEASHDYKCAKKWLKKAAANGDQKAYYYLASMYENGLGVQQNIARAFKYYQKAAVAGDSNAQNMVGNYYYYGITPIQQNYTSAKDWFEKAAEQDNLAAKNKLAGMYRLGMGVPVDTNKALDMYKHLCEKGQQTSCFAVSDISEKDK